MSKLVKNLVHIAVAEDRSVTAHEIILRMKIMVEKVFCIKHDHLIFLKTFINKQSRVTALSHRARSLLARITGRAQAGRALEPDPVLIVTMG